jgi:hypothetical protein
MLREFRVTERDLWILEALTKMKFLTTGQFATLFFADSKWSTNKRLRKLLDAGLVRVWIRSLSMENVYSITRSGLSAVEEGGVTRNPPTKVPSGLDENLDHLLAINDVRVSLALNLPQAAGNIVWWLSDWELRAHGRAKIIPDSLFMIKWDALAEQAYALEVDNNTRSSRRFLKKILCYASRQIGKSLYGISDEILLVVGCDAVWVERYRISLERSGLGNRVCFATLNEIKEKSALGPIWNPIGEEKKYSLRDLSFLPCRKERKTDECIGK